MASVDEARAAAVELAGEAAILGFEEVLGEDEHSATYYFAAAQPGYRGWRWGVTVAVGGPDERVTISETVLLPGPDALVAPAWVPWQERVRAGDLGVGDLLPTDPDDARLVPGYLHSDDPAVEETAHEVGLGRPKVLSREGRVEATERWRDGDHGPRDGVYRTRDRQARVPRWLACSHRCDHPRDGKCVRTTLRAGRRFARRKLVSRFEEVNGRRL